MLVRRPRLDASEDWAEGGGDDDRPDDEDEGNQRDGRYPERVDAQPSDGGAAANPVWARSTPMLVAVSGARAASSRS